jgi:hypothetical protein
MAAKNLTVLNEMKTRIDQIEQLVSELKAFGREVPAVQKTCRNILSMTYILKFGISDVADVYDTQGGM